MANIPVNNQAQLLIAGQSLTGSYSGFLVCSFSESFTGITTAHITGLKDSIGTNLLSSSAIFFPPGTNVQLMITSASLDLTSCPVLFYR